MLTGRKLPLTLAFAGLLLLAFGAGCKGFFQKNALNAVAIQPPSPQIQLTESATLQAWGTYQDNTRAQITSGVVWSSSAPDILSIDPSSGVATGNAVGPATITASAQGLSGTASATVYIQISSLTVTPNVWTFTGAQGGTNPVGFVAKANGSVDVTSSATFASSNTTYITCVNNTDPVFCTAIAQTPPGQYTITVSYTGSNITATIAVTAS